MSQQPPGVLPIVLVGCGAVSEQRYAPALAQLEQSGVARVQALVDPNIAARKKLAKRFPKAGNFARLEEITQLERGALAILVSPVARHGEHAFAAARCGWHILCENALAASSREGKQMLSAAETAGVRLAVGHHRRFFPAAKALKQLCAGGSPLGQLMGFSIDDGPGSGGDDISRCESDEAPGGVLRDCGIDVLDLLVWWLGAPLDYVYADDAMGGSETIARLTLRFGTATGRVQLNRDRTAAGRYAFEFARGRAVWSGNEANALALEMHGLPFTLHSALLEPDGQRTDDDRQSFVGHLRQVVRCAAEDLPMPVEGEAGAQILQLIENCYARRRLLPQPWLTPAEEESARRLAGMKS